MLRIAKGAAPCLLQPGASAAAAAVAPALLLFRSRFSTAPAHHHQLTCILPPQPSQPSLTCIGHHYADRVWSQLTAYFPDRHVSPPTVVSVTAAGHEGGHGSTPARHLEHAGFRVTSLLLRRHAPPGDGDPEARPCCLQVAFEQAAEAAASAAAAWGQPAAASVEVAAAAARGEAVRPWNGADVVVFADAMHLMDTRRGLQAAFRHLRSRGLLLVLWNDVDLSDPLVMGLEELLEATLPGYCRYDGQHDPAMWIPRLQMGGLFHLLDYSSLPHSLSLPASAFMDSLDSRGALRATLGGSGRRTFHRRLQQLVDTHCTTSYCGPAESGTTFMAGEAARATAEGTAEGRAAATAQLAAKAGVADKGQQQEQQQEQGQQGGGGGGGHGSSQHDGHEPWVHLPLHTKAYLLAKAPYVRPAALHDGTTAAHPDTHQGLLRGPLDPEHACLFCGKLLKPD